MEVRAQNIFLNGSAVATTASPTFTGTVTCPNPDPSNNSTLAATTSWVRNLLSTYATYSGSPLTSGKIVFYNGTALETSNKSVADTLDLAQQTGILPSVKVATTGLFVGATTIVDDLTQVKSTTQTLTTDLNAAKSAITSIQSNVTTLQSTTSSLSSSVSTLQTATTGLTTSVTNLQTTTSGLTTSVNSLQTTTTGLTTTTSGLTTSVNSLNGSVSNLEDDLSTLDSDTTAAINDINDTIGNIGQSLSILTLTVNSKANASHTHLGADITDADSTVGAANTIVKRSASGGILAKATASSSSAIKGDATGSSAYGVHGTNTNATGIAGYFATNSTTSPGSAITAVAQVGSNCPAVVLLQQGTGNYMELRNNTGANDVKFVVNGSLDLQWKAIGGTANTKSIAVGAATGSRVATLPDATGTIVLGDGSGITDVSAFKAVLGIGPSSSPAFSSVTVTSSTSNGYNFSSGAKIALENAANTVTYLLPHGSPSTIKLVDGEGRGISSPLAFRTAINTVSKSGDTFTGSITIDPSTGSNMLLFVGASGNTTTVTSNASASRTIAFPDKSGTLVATPDGNISVLAQDITDSTPVGRSVLTSPTAALARSAISAAENGYDIGYIDASITGVAVTATSSGGYVVANATGVTAVESSGFTISDTTKLAVTKTSAGSKKYLVSVNCAITMVTNTGRDIAIVIVVNSTIRGRSVQHYHHTDADLMQYTVQAIVTLATNDVVSVRFQDAGASPQDLSVYYGNLIVTPIS